MGENTTQNTNTNGATPGSSIVSTFTEFINKDSFNSLASCALIVGVMTQAIKPITTLNPLVIVFIMSTIVSIVKVVLSNDYSRKNIVLAAINIFPIALTAAGGYDLITTIAAASTASVAAPISMV